MAANEFSMKDYKKLQIDEVRKILPFFYCNKSKHTFSNKLKFLLECEIYNSLKNIVYFNEKIFFNEHSDFVFQKLDIEEKISIEKFLYITSSTVFGLEKDLDDCIFTIQEYLKENTYNQNEYLNVTFIFRAFISNFLSLKDEEEKRIVNTVIPLLYCLMDVTYSSNSENILTNTMVSIEYINIIEEWLVYTTFVNNQSELFLFALFILDYSKIVYRNLFSI